MNNIDTNPDSAIAPGASASENSVSRQIHPEKHMKKPVLIIMNIALGGAALVFLICMILCAVNTGFFRKERIRTYSAADLLTLLDTGWTAENDSSAIPGEEITFPDSGSLTITRNIQDLSEPDGVLYFVNDRLEITVSEDGTAIYGVNTSFMKKILHFMNYQIVRVPAGTKEISITFTGRPGSSFTVPEIYYGSYSAAAEKLIRAESFTLILLLIMLLLVLAIPIVIISAHRQIKGDHRPALLLIFLILSMIWGFADSDLPALTRLTPEFVGLLCYFSLLAMPIPISLFAKDTLNGGRIFNVLALVGSLDLFIFDLLAVLGILQLQYAFYSSFLLFLVLIGITIAVFCRNWKQGGSNPEYRLLFTGSALFALSGLSAIVLYMVDDTGLNYSAPILCGFLIFIVFLAASLVTHYVLLIQVQEKQVTEMKIAEHYSYYDVLTGLQSRRSYEKKLAEIQKLPSGKNATLIMFDVNGLKITNDTLGHAAGDDLIANTAHALEKAFGEYGNCYRIGGDEFTVILEEPNIDETPLIEKLNEIINTHNKTNSPKLSIAWGTSHLLKQNGTQLPISDWKQEADMQMYRNKVAFSTMRIKENDQDLTGIIDCIISSMEARDTYTASHSDRVRALSICIGDELGLSTSTLRLLATAAHLHDIGKIGIPDSILLKPTRLTDEEYEIMKKHPSIGAGIVSHAAGMKEVAELILHHHERYDGKGYPSGISGEDIPLGARIIAIADSIDAMTSRRYYREPFPIEKCRKEIERCSGTMYDPAIAKITLEHWNEIEKIILMNPKYIMASTDLMV